MFYYWIGDLTCWFYFLIVVMCLWILILCTEDLIDGKRPSPFFFYVMLLVFGVLTETGYEFLHRLLNVDLWSKGENTNANLWWPMRLFIELVAFGFITVDFTMRRFFGKRLFSRFYKNGIGEEES